MKPNDDFIDDGRFDPTRVGQSALATLGGWAIGALAGLIASRPEQKSR